VVTQGEIWLLETPDAKARPVLVLSRNEAIPVLRALVVAPITSKLRSIPTCLPVGRDEGLDRDGVATFDNATSVPKPFLTTRLGALAPSRRHELCDAIAALVDC
jgi:mRNA interferase MazF